MISCEVKVGDVVSGSVQLRDVEGVEISVPSKFFLVAAGRWGTVFDDLSVLTWWCELFTAD